MHSRLNIVSAELLRCKRELQSMTRLQAEMKSTSSKGTLIISTGDISDVDGFFALAEYAKTDATVLFIMNYPSYTQRGIDTFKENEFGLGYTYNAETFLKKSEVFEDTHKEDLYHTIKQSFEFFDMYTALTIMAIKMANKIWIESGGGKDKFFFCIGGVNSINPFNANKLKNELYV